jgi:hypothetical protein
MGAREPNLTIQKNVRGLSLSTLNDEGASFTIPTILKIFRDGTHFRETIVKPESLTLRIE